MKIHTYTLALQWTGNIGTGTSGYREYARSHIISVKDKAEIAGSADPAFRGDATKHNPEELFLASLSSCHMLWYLHLCADAGVVVTAYRDNPVGYMQEHPGGGQFKQVILNPEVIVERKEMIGLAMQLHAEANKKCFIANSCNFPILHKAQCNFLRGSRL